jgi:arylsulfatase A-like enzyme
VENPHNEAFQVPFIIYNPRIQNTQKKKVDGSFYTLSIPTTLLDLMNHTKSLAQESQRRMASRFAENYEFAQSLLRPVKDFIRLFFVHPGEKSWAVDNSQNLRVRPPSYALLLSWTFTYRSVHLTSTTILLD